MRKKTLFLLATILLTINGWTQEDPTIVNTSGGSAIYKENIFDWSVGEMAVVETFSINNFNLTQGFLQPSLLLINQVGQLGTEQEKIVVYSDPGKQTLFIKTSFGKPGNLNYQLFDINGRALLKSEAKLFDLNSKQSIDLLNYPNGFYLLKVYFTNNDGANSKTFKIQK